MALLVSGACLVELLAAGSVLLSGRSRTFSSTAILPLAGLRLLLDPLGALFVAIVAFVGLAATVYLVRYAFEGLTTRSATACYALFVTSLLAVPAAANTGSFMFSWELMAISSLLLLLVEHRHRQSAREAAQWYGVMTQMGAASILLGLLVLGSHAGGQTFADIKSSAAGLSPTVRSVGFMLVLFGFSSKAGAVPFHVWLPRAHPEAPSPVSALMSGAMVSLGIYGIIRVGGDLLSGGLLWWWVLVIAMGVLSALFGALHATASSDLKRLLAYSTIDNMGLVLIGVGASGALWVTGRRDVAVLAMIAALFILVVHASFKGCLFLAAGAIERSTGTRDLDQLGGLIHRMKGTASVFAIAAFSIIALPPLSGFAGEWLLFQSLLHGFTDRNTTTVIALLAGVVAFALAGGLTAVAFVKAFGIGFIGRARSPGAGAATEVAGSMVAAMVLLAGPCLVLGVVPGLAIPLIAKAANVGLPSATPNPLVRGPNLELAGYYGAIEPALLLVALVVAGCLTWGVLKLVARRATRRAEAWGCGRELQTSRMQYTATSFAEPLQRVFSDVLRPDIDVEVTHVAESRFYEKALAYSNETDDAIERSFYRPVASAFRWWGERARRIQNGSVHRYLAFGFAALVMVLVVLA